MRKKHDEVNTVDTLIEVPVNIKKGKKYGEAFVPCSFCTSNYGIDLNPSLIKKSTGEKMKIPKNKKFMYHPDEYELKLNRKEKIKFKEDFERCSHCGQKVTIAEVAAVEYRNDPVVRITLSDVATQDIQIPVKFGFNRKDFYNSIMMKMIAVGALAYAALMSHEFIMYLAFGVLVPFFSYKIIKNLKWWKGIKKLKTRKLKKER